MVIALLLLDASIKRLLDDVRKRGQHFLHHRRKKDPASIDFFGTLSPNSLGRVFVSSAVLSHECCGNDSLIDVIGTVVENFVIN